MTADERFALVRVKFERAKQHIRDLNAATKTFLDTHPYVVRTKRNPQTRQLIYYLADVRKTPPVIAAITGDALQNLRSALDHLAYHLFRVGAGDTAMPYHVYFPIFDSAAEYRAKVHEKVKGMRKDAIEAIDAVKPYKGGNDTLWRLHKLNNIDKHRFVITVGSAFRSFNLGAHMEKTFESTFPELKGPKLPPFFIKPADRLFPLKAGDELFIDGPDSEVNEKMEFRFDIAFGEPQIVEGEPILPTLHELANHIDALIQSFRPHLDD